MSIVSSITPDLHLTIGLIFIRFGINRCSTAILTVGPTPKAFGVDYNSAAPGKMAALPATTSALYSLKEVALNVFVR
jgi:hypothetical protein